MVEKLKAKLGLKNILLLVSWVLALVALIIYLVVSTTGYFAGATPNAMVVTFSILFLLLNCAYIAFGEKLGKFDFVAIFALAASLLVVLVFFIFDKEEVIGNMLVPVNHPEAEVNAATTSIVGVVFVAMSILALCVASFLGDKKAE